MALKYSATPQVHYGPKPAPDWRSRFPRNAQWMGTAPVSASRPLLLWDPAGKATWGIHHLGAWRAIEYQNDAGGQRRLRMNGKLIPNPVAWSSS